MSGIPTVSPVSAMSVTALMNQAEPKAKPVRPESTMHEAGESLSETRSEAEQGDPQAISKLAGHQTFSDVQKSEKMPAFKGGLDLQA